MYSTCIHEAYNMIMTPLYNKDTLILVPIGTGNGGTSVLRTGSVGPMVSLIKRLHCTCIKDR